MTSLPQQTVSINLRDLIQCILGDDNNGRGNGEVPMTVGVLLDNALVGSKMWKVVFEDYEGRKLASPILWRYSEWASDYETWKKRKKAAHEERVARFILDKNVDNLAYAIKRNTGLSYEKAQPIAYKIIVKGATAEVLQAMGVSHMITKEEEL